MALYEHVLLVRQDATPQVVDEILEQMKGVIEAGGGSFGRVENWGMRSLAYRMRKNRKAYYALLNITAPSAAVQEMERQLKINEDVLRFLTVKVEAHEDVPSAVLQRRERDERRDERRGERRRRDEFGDDGAPAEEAE